MQVNTNRYQLCICLEHDHTPLYLTRKLLGSSLEPKLIQVCMRSEPASIIEGYWRTRYLFLFVIGFDPSNIHVLLYVSQEYCNRSIFLNLVNWIGYFARILIIACFLITHYYFIMYSIIVQFETFDFCVDYFYLLFIVYIS